MTDNCDISSRGNNILLKLISEKKWNLALKRIDFYPTEVKIEDKCEYSPIQRACCHDDVPFQLIQSLIDVYPQSLEKNDLIQGRIPLHYACIIMSLKNKRVIQVILEHYQEGASRQDDLGQTPLQSHIRWSPYTSLEIVKMLMKYYTDAVHMIDRYKWTCLHHAAKVGNWEISQYLISFNPDALIQKDLEGNTPKIIAKYNHHKDLYEHLLCEEERRFCN